jgi:hypothetical protein
MTVARHAQRNGATLTLSNNSTKPATPLTRHHANYVLVPVKPLVSGTSIARDPRRDGSRDMSARPCITAQ